MRNVKLMVLGLAAMLALATSANAQGVRRPTVSPYLNLLRATGTPAENYYTLVRPELLFRQSLEAQGRQINQLRRAAASASPGVQAATTTGPLAIPATGHASYFQAYSHFYAIQRPYRIGR